MQRRRMEKHNALCYSVGSKISKTVTIIGSVTSKPPRASYTSNVATRLHCDNVTPEEIGNPQSSR